MTKNHSIIIATISFFFCLTIGYVIANRKKKSVVSISGDNNTVTAKVISYNGCGNGCGNKAQKTTNKK